jgi:hypothetical protein
MTKQNIKKKKIKVVIDSGAFAAHTVWGIIFNIPNKIKDTK